MIPLHSKKSQSVFWLFSALVFNSIIVGGRRAGDPGTLIAFSEKAKKIMGWQAR